MVVEVAAEAGAEKPVERGGSVGPTNKVSLGEHYLKVVEAWVLGIGIFAFGGFAYHTPMIKAGILASWKPVGIFCFILGFTVLWAAMDIVSDLLIPLAKGKKRALLLGGMLTILVIAPATWFSAMLSAEWADNNARIDWCKDHSNSPEPLCKPLRG